MMESADDKRQETQAFIQELREKYPIDSGYLMERIKCLENELLECAKELHFFRGRYTTALEIIAHLQSVIVGECDENFNRKVD